MTDKSQQPSDGSVPSKTRPRSEARRRLLHGGLGTTPLLLTLVSRPVLGAVACTSPSGFVSMPTSTQGTPTMCSGRTPGYWKQEQKFFDWPSPPYYPVTTTGPGGHAATTFNSVFGTPSPYNNSQTFLDVLRTEDQGFSGPPHDVARHVVAELLNVQKGYVTVLTKAQVINIWRSYINTGGGTVGYFQPTAGVQWDHTAIVNYLTSTMI
jgi:hypothetical protein